jgi:hypothetical protein
VIDKPSKQQEQLPPSVKITLRDYFAAMALQGLLSAGSLSSFEDAAYSAYQAADEMIEWRKRNK